jgi:uncharacterized membrane protein YjdF
MVAITSKEVRSGALARPVTRSDTETVVLLIVCLAALVASSLNPYDRLTWVLEVAPIAIFFPILRLTASRFRFTPMAYRLIFLAGAVTAQALLGRAHDRELDAIAT